MVIRRNGETASGRNGEWAKRRMGVCACRRVGVSVSGQVVGEATNGTNRTYGTYVSLE